METLLTLERAMDVLACFDRSHPRLTLTEVVTATGLAKTQTHRILTTLTARQYLLHDPGSHSYQLGPALVGLGQTASTRSDLQRHAAPALTELTHDVRESSTLCLKVSGGYRLAAAVDAPGDLSYQSIIGRIYPWYGGAGGHAIYAFADSTEIDELSRSGFSDATVAGAHSREDLNQRYESVRADGYFVSDGELDGRVMGIAAPVRAGAETIGSVCVLGIPEPMRKRESQIISAVKRAAEHLSTPTTARHSALT